MWTHLTVSLVALLCLASSTKGAVLIPQYTQKQLQDKDYVAEQLTTFTKTREDLAAKLPSAGPLIKMTVEKDLQKVDLVLEALKYVEANGYDPKDPKLKQLPYFNSSAAPVGQGLHHKIKPTGPPGGRISYLDGKPAQSGKSKDEELPKLPSEKTKKLEDPAPLPRLPGTK